MSNLFTLKEMQKMVDQEDGKLNTASHKVLQLFLQTTMMRLVKYAVAEGTKDYKRVASSLYGPKFCDDLSDVKLCLSRTKFKSLVADFCKDLGTPLPKANDLKNLQHITEYTVLRGFVRPVTKSPSNITKSDVIITDKDLLDVNHVYGLAYVELFCPSVTE